MSYVAFRLRVSVLHSALFHTLILSRLRRLSEPPDATTSSAYANSQKQIPKIFSQWLQLLGEPAWESPWGCISLYPCRRVWKNKIDSKLTAIEHNPCAFVANSCYHSSISLAWVKGKETTSNQRLYSHRRSPIQSLYWTWSGCNIVSKFCIRVYKVVIMS